jgi:hypothetical protein
VRCAKKSSFHARGGHIHRKHHPAGCSKHGSGRRKAHPDRGHHHGKRHRPAAVRPAHAGDSCPGAGEQPTQGNIETIRSATLCLVNQERTDRGEVALQFNADLQQSAQSHTESMAFGDYFEHDGPGGDTPLSRMTTAGYIPSGGNVGYEIGENIGWGTLSLGTPRAIVAAWMASPATPRSASPRTSPPRSAGGNPAVSTRRTSASSSPAERDRCFITRRADVSSPAEQNRYGCRPAVDRSGPD